MCDFISVSKVIHVQNQFEFSYFKGDKIHKFLGSLIWYCDLNLRICLHVFIWSRVWQKKLTVCWKSLKPYDKILMIGSSLFIFNKIHYKPVLTKFAFSFLFVHRFRIYFQMVLCWCWTPKATTSTELKKLEMNKTFSGESLL